MEKVERNVMTLYAKVQAMLNHAQLLASLRHGLWAEAAAMATLIENALITKDQTTAPHVLF
jgi:hypothetical protein